MTQLRDQRTIGKSFMYHAERSLSLAVEHAICEYWEEETEVEVVTSNGDTVIGLALSTDNNDDTQLYGIAVIPPHEHASEMQLLYVTSLIFCIHQRIIFLD